MRMSEKILPSVVEVPTVYGTPTVYDTGAGGGGGGGETVEIGGIKYNVISIGNQKWLDRNLYLTWAGLTINPNTDTSSAFGAYRNLDYKCSVGMAYNKAAIEYLVNHPELLNGFKVPTESDLDNLISFGGDSSLLCNDVWGGNDEFGFNLKPSGIFQSYNNTWVSTTVAHLATSHYSSDFLYIKDIDIGTYHQQALQKYDASCVRLIKA